QSFLTLARCSIIFSVFLMACACISGRLCREILFIPGSIMEQRRCQRRGGRGYVVCCIVVLLWSVSSAQIRYSVSEEVDEGTVIGNVAKDLGFDKSALKDRKYRIVSNNADSLFHVSQEDGVLYASRKIDREAVCAHSSTCLISLKTVLENPLEIHYLNIIVNILDINDNPPVFTQELYSAMLDENAPLGTTVMQVNATDLDDGLNGEVVYSFSNIVNHKLLNLFDIDAMTGEITVKGLIDYEEKDRYEIEIQASDKGFAPLVMQKSIIVKIIDVNDNAPEIELGTQTSLTIAVYF
uniref:Cadherin domain-containing protein n=1 Tax=Takifugu rubripes TaxID=31033 RepID=A0A3B5K1F8_TAKRU